MEHLLAGQSNALTRIIASDFDGTLCDTYTYDTHTNNHIPIIRQDIIDAAANSRLIVATARRASHPAITQLWACGLVSKSMPIISENGGVIHLVDGGVERRIILAPTNSLELITEWLSTVQAQLGLAPKGSHLAIKRGQTMVIARYQNKDGHVTRNDQTELFKRLCRLNPPTWLSIVHSGESICLQHSSINKGAALRKALMLIGIERAGAYVISIGNAHNDRTLFDEADLSIGVHHSVRRHADHTYDSGVDSTLHILQECQTDMQRTSLRKPKLAHVGVM